jgi:hypothetical protein
MQDFTVERFASLRDFHPAGFWDDWLALDPNDSPLLMRDTGLQDVYAFDCEGD